MMRKINILEWMSLDGIFDADSMDEWFLPYHSDSRAKYIQKYILDCGTYLSGRKTYEMLAPYWSSLKNNEMGIAREMFFCSRCINTDLTGVFTGNFRHEPDPVFASILAVRETSHLTNP